MLADLKKARTEVKECSKGFDTNKTRVNLGDAKLDKFVLFMEREGRFLKPRVEFVNMEIITIEDQAMKDDLNKQLALTGRRRRLPPYIMTNIPPTWEECVELHGLNDLQAFSFYLLIKVLLAEKENTRPEQIRMCISGQVSDGSRV